MFIQYYRYKTRYRAEILRSDPHLSIRYPADEHAMITAGHDFYVIGTIQDFTPEPDAILKAELISRETGEVLRTVWTGRKDFREGINTSYAGIVSGDTREVIRSSGMPDLVYDPEYPESFWYCWNKAYYTDHEFAVLISGGCCWLDGCRGYDQDGRLLSPIPEGYYELRVTLQSGDDTLISSKTLRMARGQKEVILSRFSPESHVGRVRRFAREEGFEEFTDPYAGIWDTQYFSFPWPVKAYIEIPARWHFGDAQEYESGRVHFFNYNISEKCVGWKTEVGTMLAGEKDCVDDPDRLVTYYYREGAPGAHADQCGSPLEVMAPGHYAAVTSAVWEPAGKGMHLTLEAVCKPLPVSPRPVTGCAYEVPDRIAVLDYAFYREGEEEPFLTVTDCRTGILQPLPDAPAEQLLLQVHHEIDVLGCGPAEKISLLLQARDCGGAVRDSKWLTLGGGE